MFPALAPIPFLVVKCDGCTITQRNGETVVEMRNAIPSEEIAPAGDFLTKAEVVQWLRISERTLENQMRAKKNPIPFRRVGRAPRFRRDEVNRWAENGESCAARRMRARLAEKTEGQGDSQRSVCVL